MLAFLFNLVVFLTAKDLEEEGVLVLLFLYAVFFFLAIVILITKISSGTTVSEDTIKGGISIYFLLGLFWAVLYMIMLTFDPNALTNVPKETAGLDCYYYSFATLTTLGYGDITPVADYAKILAILEAVAGPVYLAIFVAQIIGMNIAQKMKS
ncbi:MAG: ion channel [Planctomycetota bacterium]